MKFKRRTPCADANRSGAFFYGELFYHSVHEEHEEYTEGWDKLVRDLF